jgi:hypothetical protein
MPFPASQPIYKTCNLGEGARTQHGKKQKKKEAKERKKT